MYLDEFVLHVVEHNPDLTADEITTYVSKKVRTALAHLLQKERIEKHGEEIEGDPLRYRTHPINRRI